MSKSLPMNTHKEKDVGRGNKTGKNITTRMGKKGC